MPLINLSQNLLSQEISDFYFKCLSYHYPVSRALRDDLLKKSFSFTLKSGEYLIKTGEYCDHFYFVVKGILVGSNVLNGNSFTTFFSFRGEFVTSISGMYGTAPSKESVVALEDALIISFSARDLLRWFDIFPESNIIVRKMLETYLQRAHIRSNLFRLKSAIDKYSFYLKKLERRNSNLPIELVASFLGIKSQTLEKIKKADSARSSKSAIKEEIEFIEYQMKVREIFREKGLTISRLAQYLNIKSHRLSFLLNYYYNLNFNEFVNQHRITFVKRKFADYKTWHHLTVDGVGSEAGFSCKSSFFTAFKKSTGMTPAEFAMQMMLKG